MRKVILFVALVVLIAPAMFAQSPQTSPANPNNVSATVSGNCRVSTFNLAFGAYDPVAANATTPLTATATVNVFCTKGATFTSLILSNGANYNAVPADHNRQMTDGTDMLRYDIYLDNLYGTVWNALNPKLPTAASTSKDTAMDGGYTAYGRVLQGQDVQAGAYFDTVTATVNF